MTRGFDQRSRRYRNDHQNRLYILQYPQDSFIFLPSTFSIPNRYCTMLLQGLRPQSLYKYFPACRRLRQAFLVAPTSTSFALRYPSHRFSDKKEIQASSLEDPSNPWYFTLKISHQVKHHRRPARRYPDHSPDPSTIHTPRSLHRGAMEQSRQPSSSGFFLAHQM